MRAYYSHGPGPVVIRSHENNSRRAARNFEDCLVDRSQYALIEHDPKRFRESGLATQIDAKAQNDIKVMMHNAAQYKSQSLVKGPQIE